MGFRFRKSIKLPGGFRINVSNSGVGYSWGTKGYRITKTAKGTTRETITVPGTGISHVRESRAKHSQTPKKSPRKSDPIKQRHGCLTQIVSIPLLLLLIVGVYSGCARSAEEDPGVDRDIPVSTQPEVDSSSPSPSVSLPPSSSPSTSQDESFIDYESRVSSRQDQARECLSEEFQLELLDITSDAGISQYVVTATGVNNCEDQTEAPENWEDIQQNLISAQARIVSELEEDSQKTALILVDSQGQRLLVCRAGVIKQDRYNDKATITPSGTSSGERTVWVTNSGSRYHYDYDCSNMKNPRSISLSDAIAKGYTACSKCS